MLRTALLAAFVGAAFAVDCGFPNGTDTTFNWWQGPTTGKITFSKVVPVDANGNPVYPIHLNQVLYVSTHLDNEQGVFTNPNLLMDVDIAEYTGLSKCTWQSVPTFGLLNKLNACTEGVPCPVQMGSQDMTVMLDFTQFNSIISTLTDDAPYQLTIKLTDTVSNTYVTVVSQARCYVK